MPALHPAAAAPLGDAVTGRLAVRRLVGGDRDEMAVLFADPEVWRFDLVVEDTEAFLVRQMRLWTEYGFGGCAVRDLREGTFLGMVGLGVPTLKHPLLPSVTIGWRFSSTAWGHGYATEAGAALLRQAFGPTQIGGVGCVTNVDNRRSVALARRLGMNAVAEAIEPWDDGDGGVAVLILRVDRRTWTALEHERGMHRSAARGAPRKMCNRLGRLPQNAYPDVDVDRRDRPHPQKMAVRSVSISSSSSSRDSVGAVAS